MNRFINQFQFCILKEIKQANKRKNSQSFQHIQFTPIVQKNKQNNQNEDIEKIIKNITQKIEQNDIINETEVSLALEKFSLQGFQILKKNAVDIQVLQNMFRLALNYNKSNKLQLEKQIWFYQYIRTFPKVIQTYFHYLDKLPHEEVNLKGFDLLNFCSQSNADLSVQIMNCLLKYKPSKALQEKIILSIPHPSQFKQIKSFLNQKQIQIKLNIHTPEQAQKLLQQTLFHLIQDHHGNYVFDMSDLLLLINDLSLKSTNIKAQEFIDLLSAFHEKTIKMQNIKHYQFWINMTKLLIRNSKISNIEFSAFSKQMSIYSFLDVQNMAAEKIPEFLQQINSVDLENLFVQLTPSEKVDFILQIPEPNKKAISQNKFFDNKDLINRFHPNIQLLLLSELSEINNVSLRYENLNFDSILLLSLLKIKKKKLSNEEQYLDQFLEQTLRSEELGYDIKTLIQASIFASKNNLLTEGQLEGILVICLKNIPQMELEDLQRLLYLLNQQNVKGLSNYAIRIENKITSQILLLKGNKLSSIFYLLSAIQRKYNLNSQKTLVQLEKRIENQMNELSGQNLFLVFKGLQFYEASQKIKNEVYDKIKIKLNENSLYQNEYLEETSSELINLISNQIKQTQSVRAHQSILELLKISLSKIQPHKLTSKILTQFSQLICQISIYEILPTELKQFYSQILQNQEQNQVKIQNKHMDYIVHAFLVIGLPLDKSIINEVIDQIPQSRNYDIIQILYLLIQAQKFESQIYLKIKKFCLDQSLILDNGLLCLYIYAASLDQDSQLINKIWKEHNQNITQIVLSSPTKFNSFKNYNQDLANDVKDIHHYQLLQSLIYSGEFLNFKELQHLKLQIENHIKLWMKNKFYQSSLYQNDVRQRLEKILGEREIIEDYSEFLPFRIDFFYPELKLAVDINGTSHYYDGKLKRSDQLRQQFFKRQGLKTLEINLVEWVSLSQLKQQQILEEKLKEYI